MLKRNRMIAILLSFTLLLGSMATPAFAVDSVASGSCGKKTNWTLYADGRLVISGTGDMSDYQEFSIPVSLTAQAKAMLALSGETVPDMGEAPWHGYSDRITSVTIGSGLTSIGNFAFADCTALKEVTISDTVTKIGDYAFCNCKSLLAISLPSGVDSIGVNAFSGCASLKSVSVSAENQSFMVKDQILYNIDQSTLIRCAAGYAGVCSVPNGVAEIVSGAFSGCGEISEINLPQTVAKIGAGAFAECTGLQRISVDSQNTAFTVINNSLCSADRTSLICVFAGVGGTYRVYDRVRTIENWAFSCCNNLTEIILSADLENFWNSDYISIDAFSGCDSLLSIGVSSANTYFESINGALYSKNTTALVRCPGGVKGTFSVAEGTTSISFLAFKNCTQLNTVVIPNSVTTIYNSAFYCCKNLKTILFTGTKSEWNSIHPETEWFTEAFEKTDDNTGIKWFNINYSDPFFSYYMNTPTPQIHYGSSFAVTYDANGGTGAPDAQAKSQGIDLTLTSAVPKRSYSVTFYGNGGYVHTNYVVVGEGKSEIKTYPCSFLEWNTKADGSGKSYFPGGSYSFDESITLYAQWSSAVMDPVPGAILPESDSGNFDGWYTDPVGGIKIESGSALNQDMVLYAHWIEESSYTVSYNANGGTGAPSAQTKTENAALTLSSEIPVKTYTVSYNANGGSVSPESKTVSCAFNNWNTRQDGSGTSYSPGGIYTGNASVTLYAQWTDPAAGTLPTPRRDGYTFAGWYTDASGGTQITPSSTVNGDSTLYAHWYAPNTYTVSYNANGGTGAPEAQDKTEGVALKLSGGIPEKAYYVGYHAEGGAVSPSGKTVNCEFRNWNTLRNGSGVDYVPRGYYYNDADATLYAQWTNPYIGALPTPTRSGYTFEGWYTAASGGTRVQPSTVITGDISIYAHWSENIRTYTATFRINGGKWPNGTSETVRTLTYTADEILVAVFGENNGTNWPFTREGYVFNGWKVLSCTDDSWKTGTVYKNNWLAAKKGFTGNVVFEAQWTAIGTATFRINGGKWSNGTSEAARTLNYSADKTLVAVFPESRGKNWPFTRNGYVFNGWKVTSCTDGNWTVGTVYNDNWLAHKAGMKGTVTFEAQWKAVLINPPGSEFQWGRDNWNFINNTYTGDFKQSTMREQISDEYARVLAENLTNSEYDNVFGAHGMIHDEWKGSCYGMSALTTLSMQGYLPYGAYTSGAVSLNDLDRPADNMEVSSLITYYQLLQVKDVIMQKLRDIPYRKHEVNIKEIISLLDQYPTVMVCFSIVGMGGHAVIAYDYEYGSFTKNGVTYQGCIKICDPNSANKYDADCNIYFNTQTYQWAIPYYRSVGSGGMSSKGARFSYIGAYPEDINDGGYLPGSAFSFSDGFVSRIDAFEIDADRSISKVQQFNGFYSYASSAPDDIIEDYSYVLSNESEEVIGYNLKDADASYMISQDNPVEIDLKMDYDYCDLRAASAAGRQVIFDHDGFVEVQGESADYELGMVFDYDHPTDWFSVTVQGSGADIASLRKTEEGYVLRADTLKNVTVTANNREHTAAITFSAPYSSVLIYEIDEDTVGIRADTNGDGVYETALETENESSVLPGDVDNDGKVTASDARLALRQAVNLENYAEGSAEFLACDVDRDGKVTANDARSILRAAVGLEELK